MPPTQRWHQNSTFHQLNNNMPFIESASLYNPVDNFGEINRNFGASNSDKNVATDSHLFIRAHEQFREIVMKDILTYNAKRKLKDQPLIVL